MEKILLLILIPFLAQAQIVKEFQAFRDTMKLFADSTRLGYYSSGFITDSLNRLDDSLALHTERINKAYDSLYNTNQSLYDSLLQHRDDINSAQDDANTANQRLDELRLNDNTDVLAASPANNSILRFDQFTDFWEADANYLPDLISDSLGRFFDSVKVNLRTHAFVDVLEFIAPYDTSVSWTLPTQVAINYAIANKIPTVKFTRQGVAKFGIQGVNPYAGSRKYILDLKTGNINFIIEAGVHFKMKDNEQTDATGAVDFIVFGTGANWYIGGQGTIDKNAQNQSGWTGGYGSGGGDIIGGTPSGLKRNIIIKDLTLINTFGEAVFIFAGGEDVFVDNVKAHHFGEGLSFFKNRRVNVTNSYLTDFDEVTTQDGVEPSQCVDVFIHNNRVIRDNYYAGQAFDLFGSKNVIVSNNYVKNWTGVDISSSGDSLLTNVTIIGNQFENDIDTVNHAFRSQAISHTHASSNNGSGRIYVLNNVFINAPSGIVGMKGTNNRYPDITWKGNSHLYASNVTLFNSLTLNFSGNTLQDSSTLDVRAIQADVDSVFLTITNNDFKNFSGAGILLTNSGFSGYYPEGVITNNTFGNAIFAVSATYNIMENLTIKNIGTERTTTDNISHRSEGANVLKSNTNERAWVNIRGASINHELELRFNHNQQRVYDYRDEDYEGVADSNIALYDGRNFEFNTGDRLNLRWNADSLRWYETSRFLVNGEIGFASLQEQIDALEAGVVDSALFVTKTNLDSVKANLRSEISAISGGGITAVVEDASPTLGGDLDADGFDIVGIDSVHSRTGKFDSLTVGGSTVKIYGDSIIINGSKVATELFVQSVLELFELEDITDVLISTPTDSTILMYNQSTEFWESSEVIKDLVGIVNSIEAGDTTHIYQYTDSNFVATVTKDGDTFQFRNKNGVIIATSNDVSGEGAWDSTYAYSKAMSDALLAYKFNTTDTTTFNSKSLTTAQLAYKLNYSDTTSLVAMQWELDSKVSKSDSTSLYYTKFNVDTAKVNIYNAIGGKANSSHTHSISDITNLQDSLTRLSYTVDSLRQAIQSGIVIWNNQTISTGDTGDLLYNDGGEWKAVNATQESTSSGLLGIYLGDNKVLIKGLYTTTSLSVGVYYVDDTAGNYTNVPPDGTNEVVRIIGAARSETELWFEPSWEYIVLQ